ncbi:DNA cytosine methyltransferase [Burkholderia vietnamiensis]|uniref:DNA cytosine methyltransferase n=1 Tax=Burkholderia vietnamiensis TaxID=60552 RepID=UPI0007568011|nr:DNA cytosine methyltransferase [Burkholderia vietnamiensis]KVR99572.1 DNA methyltransferase [Burkholderia vietnamiensis]KVS32710.1 DNA methyltransferase [Burkholderia vietnamiensis]MCA7985253.1 DNA cytosine methyltransferase [Burkholderia vietnamiensis]HDR8933006.1 DNA cytosine methyltransferase [Burkholderia vietnamiensis]
MKRDLITLPLDLGSELIVDNFAGGGGASTGLERAFGRPVDIAINHDAEAIAMHLANHPHTAHYCESVFDVDPAAITGNQPVGLVWLSPDCKHFSKAKGGKPVSKKIRGLAWIALRWAATVKPRVIMLENVEEFVTWGPLGADGRPCPKNRGRTFRSFVKALARHGYRVEHRELRGCDFGAPTIRKRLFLVARRDGLPIVWPTPTHGDPKSAAVRAGALQPWRTAGTDVIDWSIPCPSIFERERPLKDATLRRIARGIMKFVVNSADPFVIHLTHHGADRAASINAPLATVTGANRGEQALVAAHITKFRANSTGSAADTPLHTVTAGGDCARPAGAAHAMGVVAATLIQTSYGERPGQAPRVPGLDKPLGTVVAQGVKHAAVTAFLAKHYGGVTGTRIDVPTGTVTTTDHHAVVTSNIVKLRGTSRDGQPADEPLHTVSAGGTHHAEVRAFLIKYYGEGGQWQDARDPMHTIPTRDRMGLVTIHGEDYAIVDIGMRMLTPRELARAQGFPDSYVLDPIVNGKPLSKSAQVRMIGNSVCPDVATALIRANFSHEQQLAHVAA